MVIKDALDRLVASGTTPDSPMLTKNALRTMPSHCAKILVILKAAAALIKYVDNEVCAQGPTLA